MGDCDTQILTGPSAASRAAAMLSQGQLVAFATETVYGLGADARDDRAVAQIYAAKGRPSFNPLIVHLHDAAQAADYVDWSADAAALAAAFWPGPFSMILPLRADHGLSGLVTAGLPTVALRVPAHPSARQLLGCFGGPVAAPSANPSGRISPTTVEHVMQGLGGKIAGILDGGPCGVGLESTILGFNDGTPVLLRPGAVTAQQIEAVLGRAMQLHAQGDAIIAPGQLLSHYAPVAAVRLNADEFRTGERRLGFGPVACDLNLSEKGDLIEAAANLFSALHALDDGTDGVIAVSPIPNIGLGVAINDRLQRAAAPR